MKTKIIVSLIIITCIATFQLIKPLNNFSNTDKISSPSDSLPFIIGAYANANESDRTLLTDSLGLNMWHAFLKESNYATLNGKKYYRPLGWDPNDSLFFPDNQSTNYMVTNVLNLNGSKLRTLMSRPKIEWLFFAQRSDYQCEPLESLENSNYNWFYTYKEHPKGTPIVDNSVYGNGASVMLCSKTVTSDSGYVVKGLRTNREQVNTGNPGHGNPYPGFGDGQFSWYVKPRIRIDASFAANPANDEKVVCRIEVYDYEGNPIKMQDIKVINFKESTNAIYHGNYLETFYPNPNAPIDLTIPGGWSFNPNNKEWVRYTKDNCKVDFRVFWYGKCDMWIDYVRVDDDRANRLFKDGGDVEYEAMIQQEVRNAQYNNSPLLFYVDEFVFNHIPAISYVMKKIQNYAGSQNPPFGLATNIPREFYNNHLDSGWLMPDHLERYMLDSCKVKLYCKSNSYPFSGRKDGNTFVTNLPNTLPTTNSSYNFAKVIDPNSYENWLQAYIKTSYKADCDEFVLHAKHNPEMLTCFSIQTHALVAEGILREPTNEEIKMNVNMALSYGFKGIIYYAYDAFGRKAGGTFGPNWSVGIVEQNDAGSLIPRRINFYGQKKWDEIKQINSTLKKWAPYMQSFDVNMTKTFLYDTPESRGYLFAQTYISELRAYQPDNSISPNPSSVYDEPNQTYSQVATFNNNASLNNYTNYFMVVNRRCSPHRQDAVIPGGLRYIKIQLTNNKNTFAQFNNWVIKDVSNDSVIKVFNKNALSFIDLGWYEPGEGKLYKITPVM